MALTSAQARTQLTNRNENVLGPVGGLGHVLTINLVIGNGVTYTPETLFDALTTLFGAGKVLSDKDVMSHNTWNLRIIP